MSAVKKGIKKVGKTVGGAVKGLFRAPKIVVEDNSQQVADAINKQAEDERNAKAEMEEKERLEKDYRSRVEKDQRELDGMKAIGTPEVTESDLASSGLNEVNADFSKTLIESEEEKKRRGSYFRNALMPRR